MGTVTPCSVISFPATATGNLFLTLVESSPSPSSGNSTFYWCSWFIVTVFYITCLRFFPPFLKIWSIPAFKRHVASVQYVMWPQGLEVCFPERRILRRAHYFPIQITHSGVSSCSGEQLPSCMLSPSFYHLFQGERHELPLLSSQRSKFCLLKKPDYFKSKSVQLGWKVWHSILQNGKLRKALIQTHFYGSDKNIWVVCCTEYEYFVLAQVKTSLCFRCSCGASWNLQFHRRVLQFCTSIAPQLTCISCANLWPKFPWNTALIWPQFIGKMHWSTTGTKASNCSSQGLKKPGKIKQLNSKTETYGLSELTLLDFFSFPLD